MKAKEIIALLEKADQELDILEIVIEEDGYLKIRVKKDIDPKTFVME